MKTLHINPVEISFESGESRHGTHGVNYMLYRSGDVILYAETPVPGGVSEDYGYFALRAEVLRQAAEEGISADRLVFWYDGQEKHLSADAGAACNVEGW